MRDQCEESFKIGEYWLEKGAEGRVSQHREKTLPSDPTRLPQILRDPPQYLEDSREVLQDCYLVVLTALAVHAEAGAIKATGVAAFADGAYRDTAVLGGA